MYKIFLVLLLLVALGYYSKWRWKTEQVYLDTPEEVTCRYKVHTLSKKLWNMGECFDVVYGTYGGESHVWIEKDNRILDPSVCDTREKCYEEGYRLKYRGGQADVGLELHQNQRGKIMVRRWEWGGID